MAKPKTHCKYGHEFTKKNTCLVYEDGYKKKRCVLCNRLRQRKFQGYTGKGNTKKLLKFCSNGHEFTKENTYIKMENGVKCRQCKICKKNYKNKWEKDNREHVNKRQRKWRENLSQKQREKYSLDQRIRFEKIRLQVLSYYAPNLKCVCCGESELRFLTIDHINNDGNVHKKQNKISRNGIGIYYWLIKNNFPKGFQILCLNCNVGKHLNKGRCPHKSKIEIIN